MIHLVIMAGGIGSRFWPVSTPEYPKQFIDVLGCGQTLLQLTVDRFQGICPMENTWVVTSGKYVDIVKEQLPEIPHSNILLEPCMRNTAPCIAYVSWKIAQKDPDANIVVASSDQFVVDKQEFKRVIQKSLEFSDRTGAILTLGMKVTRPDTGYGYIQGDFTSSCTEEQEIKKVKAFKEKPDKITAEQYMDTGEYFWNAGIFIWKISTIINAITKYQPQIARIFTNLSDFFYTDKEQEQVDLHFPECPNISIDYAVLEKAEQIYVFPADFGWSDLGSWGALYNQLPQDENKNTYVGQNIKMIESNNCIVHTSQNKKIVIQGLDNYIIAEKEGVLLICKKTEEQRIKEFST